MQLSTDYPQWYDVLFDKEGPVFERMAFTRGGLAKREQLRLFEKLGLKTPPHGTVRELAAAIRMPFGGPIGAWKKETELVVYEDELLHAGKGKRRMPFEEAEASHPDHYATVFVPPRDGAVNLRHARFGRIGIWLRQRAEGGDWRSNIDDAEQMLARTAHPEPPPVPRVLWAIDFLPSPFGLLAIDFNTAPQLVTVGESGSISVDEIRRELEAADLAHLRQL
jgi:hypothetical protein